ncbi:enoyl-CoA hydratase/isomerase family protein [Zobellia galactanivorans]|uniref:Enoyl-CoA hydratase/isomerase family n=1 Tax=Zobellia galactanivorans (strain DSM 12802 / CCUG 47099 / CIP 106680 / NCIMB 13871 / Dsij) TaxID=63186 RepID=G0L4A7_ZOBGA|nr:enoyl-CoA hydratase/isomerase family protein [Zobellia galactanivorans]MBU3027939.1 enoyl-CoA hydratase/isomerase family protein [Zobellia galactanivorans]CAZ95596.1 Enoyl-CoA hydratase/isomerase family [Zobellia galactanivorans]
MGTTRENGSLYTKIDNKVATIEFGHPASNSFVAELLDRLTLEFKKLSENNAITVIVLRSEGDRAFCAGASFDELMAVSDLDEGKVFFSGFAHVINAMRQCKKVIVGRVQGKTVGGGVGLAAACDYVYASEAASIRLSELTIGIAPLVIAPAVERKIGTAAISELSLAPTEWKNAYWAQEKGLFSKVFDDMRELDKELDFQVQKLAEYNPEALEEWKKVLWQGTDHWNELLVERAAITGRLVLSEFTRNALSKFKK